MTDDNDRSVDDYIASLDEQTASDSSELLEMMRRISGQEPTLWNVGTIGFGTYHYRYDSDLGVDTVFMVSSSPPSISRLESDEVMPESSVT